MSLIKYMSAGCHYQLDGDTQWQGASESCPHPAPLGAAPGDHRKHGEALVPALRLVMSAVSFRLLAVLCNANGGCATWLQVLALNQTSWRSAPGALAPAPDAPRLAGYAAQAVPDAATLDSGKVHVSGHLVTAHRMWS